MSKRWYGELTNRLEEGQNFTGRELRAGDDITEYLWSDRHCYYIDEVITPKRIKVRPYYVCADREKADGMGHQDWLYFKTWDERNKYLCKYFPSDDPNEHREEPRAETWVFRYNKWMREHFVTEMRHPDAYTKREREQFEKNGWCFTYSNLTGKVSFGVRDYYYDWEF